MVLLTKTIYKMVRYLLNFILLITLWIACIQIHHGDSASLNDPEVKKDYKEIKSIARQQRIQEKERQWQLQYEKKMKELGNDTNDDNQKNKADDKVESSTTKPPNVAPTKIKARGHRQEDKYKREWNVKETDGL